MWLVFPAFFHPKQLPTPACTSHSDTTFSLTAHISTGVARNFKDFQQTGTGEKAFQQTGTGEMVPLNTQQPQEL